MPPSRDKLWIFQHKILNLSRIAPQKIVNFQTRNRSNECEPWREYCEHSFECRALRESTPLGVTLPCGHPGSTSDYKCLRYSCLDFIWRGHWQLLCIEDDVKCIFVFLFEDIVKGDNSSEPASPTTKSTLRAIPRLNWRQDVWFEDRPASAPGINHDRGCSEEDEREAVLRAGNPGSGTEPEQDGFTDRRTGGIWRYEEGTGCSSARCTRFESSLFNEYWMNEWSTSCLVVPHCWNTMTRIVCCGTKCQE